MNDIRVLPTGPFKVNTLVIPVGDESVVVVDPGNAAPVLRTLESTGRRLDAVILTHGHVDHAAGLSELLRSRPAPVFLHEADAPWTFSSTNVLPPWYPVPPEQPRDLRLLSEEILNFGPVRWRVIATPGHTAGGICVLLEDGRTLLSGDTLFREGVGRTDLPVSDGEALRRSLAVLMQLPDEVRIFPGHGRLTSIGHERRHNPFLESA